jgi:hypothetical protein
VGARAGVREPLLGAQLLPPTRLVSKHGHVHDGAPRTLDGVPMYATLSEAFAAITSDASRVHEVVSIEDSATYAEGILVWPSNVVLEHLTIQAAELARPTLELVELVANAGLPLDELELIGLAIGAPTLGTLTLPTPLVTRIAFCTINYDDNVLRFVGRDGQTPVVELFHAVTGPIVIIGGRLSADTSIVHALTGGHAINAPEGIVELQYVTLDGFVDCLELHASDCIFHQRVKVDDRFRGCIRYSRATDDSTLPNKHRVVDIEAEVLSRDRSDPRFQRLAPRAPRALTTGAENGSEMGAFNSTHLTRIYEGLRRRLEEHTPAGLVTGLVRLD